MSAASVICLIPMRDEAWVLERTIRTTLTWADELILLDQGSTDGSRRLAAQHERVHVIEETSLRFDETARRARLLAEARKRHPEPCVLVGLDADEVLGGPPPKAVRRTLLDLPRGSFGEIRWVQLLPGVQLCAYDGTKRFVFSDDRRPATGGGFLHAPRFPVAEDASPTLELNDLVVLHYQSTDPLRMRSKHRWYQCLETIRFPRKRAAEIYRQYAEAAISQYVTVAVDPRWLEHYERLGIDMRSTRVDGQYRWDADVLDMLREHGARRFRKVDIWDVDWNALASGRGAFRVRDPRTPVDRLALRWLRWAQPRRRRHWVRAFSRCLRLIGW
jgi:Glycosyl transferase family 2